jgi:hypothetical protein
MLFGVPLSDLTKTVFAASGDFNFNRFSKFFRSAPVSLCFCLLFSIQTFGQEVIKGTVVDEQNNEPLLGATVAIQNSTDAAVADAEGKFFLTTKRSIKKGPATATCTTGSGSWHVTGLPTE